MRKRLIIALIVYAVLTAIACLVLRDEYRWAVLLLLGGLLVKSLIAWKAGWVVPDCNADPDSAFHNETSDDKL